MSDSSRLVAWTCQNLLCLVLPPLPRRPARISDSWFQYLLPVWDALECRALQRSIRGKQMQQASKCSKKQSQEQPQAQRQRIICTLHVIIIAPPDAPSQTSQIHPPERVDACTSFLLPPRVLSLTGPIDSAIVL